jgi:hypothetical protein
MSTSKVNMSLDDIIKSRRGQDRGFRGRRGGRGGNRNQGGRGPRRDFGDRRRYNKKEGGNTGSTRLKVSDLPTTVSNNDLRVR